MTFRLSFGISFCLLLMLVIWFVGPYSTDINFTPDQGPFWYYWKLPEPTFWTRFSSWILYTAHQVSIWWLIVYAKNQKLSYNPKSKSGLHNVNIIALLVNLFFVIAHIIQTKVFYDGLAQDTSNIAAQFSVILLLALVLILENKRRGLFLGKKVKWMELAGDTVKQYHGYYFAWAIIYTFWFHPIEITLGHMLGTLYVLFFLVQGSLFFTTFHTNKYWRLFLEMFVLIHAVIIASFSIHNESVSMFFFGFLTLFFVTGIYGLQWSKKVIAISTSIYLLAVTLYYWPNLLQASEIIRIPVILYFFAVVLALIIIGVNKFKRQK